MKNNTREKAPNFSDKIPFMAGRPDRETSIAKDDLLNLVIALEIHRDITLFWEDKHIFR